MAPGCQTQYPMGVHHYQIPAPPGYQTQQGPLQSQYHHFPNLARLRGSPLDGVKKLATLRGLEEGANSKHLPGIPLAPLRSIALKKLRHFVAFC